MDWCGRSQRKRGGLKRWIAGAYSFSSGICYPSALRRSRAATACGWKPQLLLPGFFEGFGHGLMGKSDFGGAKVALGGLTAFGRDLA